MSTARALNNNSHLPSIIPRLNPLIRRLIGAGLPFGPNVLITIRGRSSGVERTFPIALLEHEGRRYVQSPFGEVNWVHNLRAAGEATVKKGRNRETVEAIEVPPEQAGQILRNAACGAMAAARTALDRRVLWGTSSTFGPTPRWRT